MNSYDFLNKDDLFIAYKKAKFELFNDKSNVSTTDLLSFESDLGKNIDSLFDQIAKSSLQSLATPSYWEIPKELKKLNEKKEIEEEVHFFSNSITHHRKTTKIEELIFRKVIYAGMDFHIVSAVWVNKIGQYIDEKLGKNIYGSRLVRVQSVNDVSCEFDSQEKDYNIDSPRIFQPYQHLYQNWRNKSFDAIKELHKTSSVITMTMDISSFFHSINLQEFKLPEFYNEFGLDKVFKNDDGLQSFHEDFIDLLIGWNESLTMTSGLPVGLSASPILANAVMKQFDNQVIKYLSPAYYGRYVDDILLVIANPGDINSAEDVLKLLTNKLPSVNKEKQDLKYEKKYKQKIVQKLFFKASKQKIFFLDKDADLSIIQGIELEINAISSEWRFMPDIACDHSSLVTKLVGFYSDGKEFNDALRKIDSITMKRLGLSLLLSQAHALNEYIDPAYWKEKRYAIYQLISNHIFIPQNFFDTYIFLSRIFRLMVHSGDGEKAYCFLNDIQTTLEYFSHSHKDVKKVSSLNSQVGWAKFIQYHRNLFQEVFIESYSFKNNMSPKYAQKIIDLLFLDDLDMFDKLKQYFEEQENNTSEEGYKGEEDFEDLEDFDDIHVPIFLNKIDNEIIQKFNQDLFFRDLSFDSYTQTITYSFFVNREESLFNRMVNGMREQNEEGVSSIREIRKFSNVLKDSLGGEFHCILPLLFPTRPFTPMDISIVIPFEKDPVYKENFFKYVNALRGTHSAFHDNKTKKEYIDVSSKYLSESMIKKVAVTSYKVEDKQWLSSVKNTPDKSLNRYCYLEEIINDAVKKRPHYLVLPELAIPRDWAWLVSRKLSVNKISFITGVEYLHKTSKTGQKIMHNSIMMYLISDDLGFNSMRVFRQDKIEGAHKESIDVRKIVGASIHADLNYKDKQVYKHGNFYFSCLICNELTDIDQRANLRGKIDNLFVVEWNQDIKSFNSLVESSALDIHSYVTQVNNRKYGDSRIRAPYKNEHQRDIVRVFGGNHNYVVVGEINVEELREFQSYKISPDGPFKPVPAGFSLKLGRGQWKNGDLKC